MAAVGALSAGCKSAKQRRCEKLVDDLHEMMGRMAKALGAEPQSVSHEERADAIQKCMSLSDDELDCSLNPNASTDPKCVALEKKKPPVEWEAATLLEGRVEARVPKGWEHEVFMGDRYTPTNDFRSRYRVDTTCGGACIARSAAQWEAVVFEEFPTRPRDLHVKVRKDLKPSPTSRVIVSDTGDDVADVDVFLWHEGARFYIHCEARLDMPYVFDLESFERSCLDAKVDWQREP